MASNYLPVAKKMLQAADNKYTNLGAQALDTLGYGKMGGISTAGRMASKLL
jgi:hypothetical protein